MARPKKLPTKVVRINIQAYIKAKRNAKRRGMSLPDYLAWRLNK